MFFLYEFLFLCKFTKNFKIKFNYSNVQIIYPPKTNKNIKSKIRNFKNKINVYYEFPPIIKFDLNKRFNKIKKNFQIKINNKTYKVKNPITNTNEFKFNKNILEEMSSQYGNICYLKLK